MLTTLFYYFPDHPDSRQRQCPKYNHSIFVYIQRYLGCLVLYMQSKIFQVSSLWPIYYNRQQCPKHTYWIFVFRVCNVQIKVLSTVGQHRQHAKFWPFLYIIFIFILLLKIGVWCVWYEWFKKMIFQGSLFNWSIFDIWRGSK